MIMRMKNLLATTGLLLPLLGQSVLAAEEAPEPGPVPAMPAPEAHMDRLLDITVAGDRAVAIGHHGVILTSEDGKTWAQSDSPVSTMLTKVMFSDENNGWVLGYDATIMKTTDGGLSWSLKHYDLKARPLFDMLFLDPKNAIAIGGYGTQLVTTDGGESWREIKNELTDVGMHLNEIVRLGDNSLFIAGERGLLARSTDEAETWQMLESPYKGSFFGGMTWGPTGVMLYGMRGNVFLADDVTVLKPAVELDWDIFSAEVMVDPAKSEEMGWKHVKNPSSESIFGAMEVGARGALFVGVNGSIVSFDPKAESLNLIPSPIDQTLAGVAEFKGQTLAVGRRGIQPIGAK